MASYSTTDPGFERFKIDLPPSVKLKAKDRSIKFDIFIKFKDMEDEDPIELLEVETLDDLIDALEKLLEWPLIVSLREIIIDVEEVGP